MTTPAVYRETFATPYDQYSDRRGQPFTVLGYADPSTYDKDEVGVQFRIRFEDGVEIVAWPEEVQMLHHPAWQALPGVDVNPDLPATA